MKHTETTTVSHLVTQGDGYEVRHYSYDEARELFRLPKGRINVEELSRYLSDKAPWRWSVNRLHN